MNLRGEPGGWTLLHAAAFTDDTDMLELLLSRGADPVRVATASEGETPLGVAFYFGHEEVADLLVRYGGGDPLPEGLKWSEIPGWAEGSYEGPDDGEEGRLLDLSEAIARFLHLWFLWFLLWLVAGFALVATLVERRQPTADGPREGHRARWLMWSMIPLTLLPQLYMGGGGLYPTFGPHTSDGWIPYPHVLAYYATFFTFGALMYGRQGRGGTLVVDTIGSRWWLWLPLTLLVVFPAGLVFTFVPEIFSWPVASILQVAFAWGMCIGLLGLFRAVLSGERPSIRYLSDSSYWLYLIHLPVILVAQVMARDWNLAAEIKFLLISVVVTAVLLASYQLFVRYTPIGTMLNGKKLRPSHQQTNPA